MRSVKSALPFAALAALSLCACNTIENRRSTYAVPKANGPYTRSLQDGSWREGKTVDQQYAEAQAQKRREGKPAPSPMEPPPAEEPPAPPAPPAPITQPGT